MILLKWWREHHALSKLRCRELHDAFLETCPRFEPSCSDHPFEILWITNMCFNSFKWLDTHWARSWTSLHRSWGFSFENFFVVVPGLCSNWAGNPVPDHAESNWVPDHAETYRRFIASNFCCGREEGHGRRLKKSRREFLFFPPLPFLPAGPLLCVLCWSSCALGGSSVWEWRCLGSPGYYKHINISHSSAGQGHSPEATVQLDWLLIRQDFSE